MIRLALALAILAFAPVRAAETAAPSLAPTGTLRAAINFGNPVLAQHGPDGEPRGVSVDLARELARQLGVPVQFVPFAGAGLVTDSIPTAQWDICFLAVDPKRAQGIDFTAPYVVIEGAYLVPKGSPIHSVDEVDRDGIRVMVDRGSAYDLYLQRSLKHATLVYPPVGARTANFYLEQPTDVLAGVRQPLVQMANEHADYRMIPGRFMQIEQAMATLKGRGEGLTYLKQFVEEQKASGFVAASLKASGQADAAVAPPAAR